MNWEFLLCIIGCALVTILPRILPLMYLSVQSLPPIILQWLSFVPVSVMAALLFPDVVLQDGELDISLDNIYFVAAIPSLLVSWRTESFFGTIACAMGTVAFLRWVGW